MNKLRAAFVIGRRDYTATVFSRSFLFFLLGPLFPILLGILFGGMGARAASEDAEQRVAVIASAQDFAKLAAAREELAALPGRQDLPVLQRVGADESPRQALSRTEPAVVAVLSGLPNQPRLIGAVAPGDPLLGQLQLILSRTSNASQPFPGISVERVAASTASTRNIRSLTARAGQTLLFLLTLLLAGMLLSQLIEEKSNKVIEVLAAAVPVESIFMGKLFAMLAMSLTGIAVWASAATVAVALLAPPGALAALPAPAVGWPLFALLGAAYFAMSYLLIGAAFMGIGAQASTVREVQTLSMPVTMSQVALFFLASFAVDDPAGPGALAAALFPLTSPFAMIARAALEPAVWPHLVALGWQALWVSLILKLMSGWFRRSVLSGHREGRRWWRRRAAS